MSINVDTLHKKMELIQWLAGLEDVLIIDKLMVLRERTTSDLWDELPEDERASIEKGLEDAHAGKLHPHSQARKKYEKWL